MKKLTDWEIEQLWGRVAGISEPGKRRVAFGQAVQAEVLRLNGITEQQPDKANSLDELRRQMREVTEAAYKTPGKAVRMPDLVVTEGRKFMRGEPSLFDELTFGEVQLIGVDLASETPRATGCPDTMDDTAQYAVDQKAAGEEKSPPATGPAG